MSTYVSHYQGPRNQSLQTPMVLFGMLHARYRFTMDGAASPDNALMPRYSSVEAPLPWVGERVFCNPPWGNIPPFVELAATASFACLLVPARTNCGWFHRALELGARVEFFKGRPNFDGGKSSSPVDCLLLLFGHGEAT
jgi:DNA N-6-adenine-methyltransferase (Dam)